MKKYDVRKVPAKVDLKTIATVPLIITGTLGYVEVGGFPTFTNSFFIILTTNRDLVRPPYYPPPPAPATGTTLNDLTLGITASRSVFNLYRDGIEEPSGSWIVWGRPDARDPFKTSTIYNRIVIKQLNGNIPSLENQFTLTLDTTQSFKRTDASIIVLEPIKEMLITNAFPANIKNLIAATTWGAGILLSFDGAIYSFNGSWVEVKVNGIIIPNFIGYTIGLPETYIQKIGFTFEAEDIITISTINFPGLADVIDFSVTNNIT